MVIVAVPASEQVLLVVLMDGVAMVSWAATLNELEAADGQLLLLVAIIV